MEVLRLHLHIERWRVAGVSWGTTLALAYAQSHPDRVSELVLAAVALTTPRYVEWITEGVGMLFPQAWERFEAASRRQPGQRLVDAYQTLLTDPNPSVRAQAALDWAAWEDAHISLDPHWQPAPADDAVTRWQVLATLVTHYWKHAAFLPADGLISGLTRLRDTPTVLIHGRYDVSGPIGAAWAVHRALPGSRFVQIDGEGHGGPAMMEAVAEATTNFMV
ncbi:MAG: alpha/beta fold hydrolase [Propionibacteriaceae bacterium]|nr:alpha/beta fold hydrolase [Propionibacteriaceae bacterium]